MAKPSGEKPFNIFHLLVAVLICESIGILGAIFTTPAIPTWYAQLNKPSFSPPNWLFGPVWTLLYAMMGISVYLIWKKGFEKTEVREGVILFGIHLVVNFLWSFLFFGLKSPAFAFADILLLWSLIGFLIYKFRGIDFRAALLLIPYFAWVSFATILNFSLWRLN